MPQIRCYGCASFFDKRDGSCPTCGKPVRGVNIALVNSRWSSNLNAHAAHAVKYG